MRAHFITRFAALGVGLLALTGCPEQTVTPAGDIDPAVSTVTVSRSKGVIADGVDKSFINVKLLDKNQNPIKGKDVELIVTGSGNTLTQPSSSTNDYGMAIGSISSTEPELKTITAKVGSVTLEAKPTVEFVTSVRPAVKLSVTVPASALVGAALQPAVTVSFLDDTDAVTPVTGTVQIKIGDNPGTATLGGTVSAAAVDGVATFADLTLSKVGKGYTLVASAETLPDATSQRFDINPGAATALVITELPATATAGGSLGFTVTAQDAQGNVATGFTGTVTIASGDPQATLPAAFGFAATDAGVHAFTGLVLKTSGAQTVTASDGTLTGTGNVAVSAGAATRLLVSGLASPVTAGTEGTLSVVASDDFGNTDASYTGTVKITVENEADPAATLPADYAFVAADGGAHSFKLTLKTAGLHDVVATDTVTSAISGKQSGVQVVPTGTATVLVIAGLPASVVSGEEQTFTVTGVDGFGNTVVGYQGPVSFSTGVAKDVLPAQSMLINGTGSFKATFKTAGARTLAVTDGTITGTAATNVTAGAAAVLAFKVQPTKSGPGTAISPAVEVKVTDANGNTNDAATNSITLELGSNPGSAVLSGTLTAAAVAGVATFSDLKIDTVGLGYSLVAKATNLTSATSAQFDVILCTANSECLDADLCTTDTCNPANGACVHAPVAIQDDSNACTTDTCDSATGLTVHTALPIENDSNACTTDGCNPATGAATHVALPIENDGNACTTDGCDPATGAATHVALPIENDNNACTTDGCDPATGAATHVALPIENDSNACTTDGCDPATGAATHVALPIENDNNACTTDGCNPATGLPTHVALVCNDNNACNGVETCNIATGCVPGAAPLCDDANACNGVETCNAATGCVPGTALVCDDSNACNGVETCNATTGCVPGTPLVCNDGNACNGVETCSAATGCVPGTALTCNDGNACNGVETCNPATGCVPGTALTCNDGNGCTTDTCAPATGCVYTGCSSPDVCYSNACCTPACTGKTCGDNGCGGTCGLCTGTDVCNASGVCVPGAYRHTVNLADSGYNDFWTGEFFNTTSAGYIAYITWDAVNLYIGYSGADVTPSALNADKKWLFVYLDTDPGGANGSSSGVTYNTQSQTMPAGFKADYHYATKMDFTYAQVITNSGGTWGSATSVTPPAHAGTYTEFAIPLAGLGSPAKVGVVTLMLNELGGSEWTYAGLYTDNFTDSYGAPQALTKYLLADFASGKEPNDAANKVECATAAQCSAPADPCLVAACNSGKCGTGNAPALTACSTGGEVCNGAGVCKWAFSFVRVGNGSVLTSGTAAPTFIETRWADGTTTGLPLDGVVALPTAAGTAPQTNICAISSSQIEGFLNRSANKKYLTVGGYAVAPGTTVPGTVLKSVARIDALGNIDTTTTTTAAAAGGNIRSVVSSTGGEFWLGTSTGGIVYEALGSALATSVLSGLNVRSLGIFGGQLFGDYNNAGFSVGTGLPTASGQTKVDLISGMNSGYGMLMLDLPGGFAGLDTWYVCDDGSAPGLHRYTTADGLTWTEPYHLAVGACRGVTGFYDGTNVNLFVSTTATPTTIRTFVDTGIASPTTTVLLTAATNTLIRGLTVAPTR
ncbi:MAG TPA: invasin domain 3-containing protein [Myxococcales bacterium]